MVSLPDWAASGTASRLAANVNVAMYNDSRISSLRSLADLHSHGRRLAEHAPAGRIASDHDYIHGFLRTIRGRHRNFQLLTARRNVDPAHVQSGRLRAGLDHDRAALLEIEKVQLEM